MTAAKNTTKSSGLDASVPAPRKPTEVEVERLQARIEELEKAAKKRSPASTSARTVELQRVAIGVLGGTVVVTAPLAFVTLKRWWRWWTI